MQIKQCCSQKNTTWANPQWFSKRIAAEGGIHFKSEQIQQIHYGITWQKQHGGGYLYEAQYHQSMKLNLRTRHRNLTTYHNICRSSNRFC